MGRKSKRAKNNSNIGNIKVTVKRKDPAMEQILATDEKLMSKIDALIAKVDALSSKIDAMDDKMNTIIRNGENTYEKVRETNRKLGRI